MTHPIIVLVQEVRLVVINLQPLVESQRLLRDRIFRELLFNQSSAGLHPELEPAGAMVGQQLIETTQVVAWCVTIGDVHYFV